MKKIDAIGTVEYTAESKALIDAARSAYDALTAEQKGLVSNYNVLTEAEKTYKNIFDNCAAIIGDKYYLNLIDAYQDAKAGAIIKLNKDADIHDKDKNYIKVKKNITYDLNGHTLILNPEYQVIIAVEGAIITITNNVPATGGIKGQCGVDYKSGSYLLLKDCRFQVRAEMIKMTTHLHHVAEGYIVKDINKGNIDENGFVCIVREITGQDYADEVIEKIDAIGTVEYI